MKYVSYTNIRSIFPNNNTVPSIGEQNDEIDTYAKNHGIRINKKYSDRAHGETNGQSFERLLRDGINRCFDCAVLTSVWQCPSFPLAVEVLHETFYPAGIDLIVTEDDFDSREKDPESVKKYFSEKRGRYKSAVMAERNRKAYLGGKIQNQSVPFGYSLCDDGSIVPNEFSDAVREIFAMAARGRKCSEIAGEMNTRGVPTPSSLKNYKNSSSKWGTEAIRQILSRDVYTGTKEPFFIPPLISAGEFQKASDRRAAFSARYAKKTIPKTASSVLRGLVFDTENTMLTLRNIGGVSMFVSKNNFTVSAKSAEQAVINAVIDEKDTACRILENIDVYKEMRIGSDINMLRGEIQAVFLELNRRLDMFGCDELDIVLSREDAFCSVTEKYDRLKKAYSEKNPYLKLWSGLDVSDLSDISGLTQKFVRRTIERVVTDQSGRISIVPKHNEWKEIILKK